MAKRSPQAVPEGASPTFEDSLSALQGIVLELEEGAIGLEASLAQFERGIQLLRNCYAILEAAEARVELLTRIDGDEVQTAPFDSAATFDGSRGEPPREKPSLF